MVTNEHEKIKIIQTPDPKEFEKQFNEATDQLQGKKYTAKVQPFTGKDHCAYIFYEELEEIYNLVSDEFHLQGIHYLCSQCPYHEPQEDGRKKLVWCKYADNGFTDLRHEACEMFYTEVKQKKVKPVY